MLIEKFYLLYKRESERERKITYFFDTVKIKQRMKLINENQIRLFWLFFYHRPIFEYTLV